MVHLEINETQRINHHTGIHSSDMFSLDLPIWIFPEHFLTMYSEYQRLIGKSVLPDIPLNVRIIARVAKWESKRYSIYKAIVKYLWHFPHFMSGLDEEIDSLQVLYKHVLTLTPPLEKERLMAEKKKIKQQKKKNEEEKKEMEEKRYEAAKKKTELLQKKAALEHQRKQEKEKERKEKEEKKRIIAEEKKLVADCLAEKNAEAELRQNERHNKQLLLCRPQYKYVQKKKPVIDNDVERNSKKAKEAHESKKTLSKF